MRTGRRSPCAPFARTDVLRRSDLDSDGLPADGLLVELRDELPALDPHVVRAQEGVAEARRQVDRVEGAVGRPVVDEPQVVDEVLAGRAVDAGLLDALDEDLAAEPTDVGDLV